MTLYEVSTHKIFFLTKFLPVTDDIICFFCSEIEITKTDVGGVEIFLFL